MASWSPHPNETTPNSNDDNITIATPPSNRSLRNQQREKGIDMQINRSMAREEKVQEKNAAQERGR